MALTTKSLRGAALVVIASLAFTACGGAVTPSAAPTGTPTSVAPSAAVTPEPGTLPTPELSKLAIGLSASEMSSYAGKLAEQLGLYKKYGIDVEVSMFEGDARLAAALQAGQVQIAVGGAAPAISSQLTDVPFNVMGIAAVILTDNLVCQSGIDTAEEVKGKTIAISTFGGTSNAAALLALKALGLKPTEAAITQIGGQSIRLAALQGGSIDCAIIDSNLEDDMIAQGFGIATRLKEAGIAYSRAGVMATKEFIAANPNTVLVILAAILEAQNVIFTDPRSVIPYYVAFTGLEEEKAAKQVNNFVLIGNRSLMWTDEALRNAQKALAMVNPDIIDVAVADVGNRTFLETLAANGFYDKIGSPKP